MDRTKFATIRLNENRRYTEESSLTSLCRDRTQISEQIPHIECMLDEPTLQLNSFM